MKKKIRNLFLLLSFFFITFCTSYTYEKGNYIGYTEKVNKSKVIGHGVDIGKIIKPDENSPFLKIQVLKVNVHPLMKVKKYERILRYDLSNEMGFNWALYGMGIGFIAGIIQYEGKDPNSGAKSTIKSLEWGLGGLCLGSFIGKFKKRTEKRSSPIKEETSVQLGKSKGESIGVVPNQVVTLKIPSLGQILQAVSSDDGFAIFDLQKNLLINEWPLNKSNLKVIVQVADAKKEININPNFFLKPYLKITRTKDNIRSGPGIRYPIIAHCYKNEKYRIISTVGNWYKIRYRNRNAWIHKSLGEIVKGSIYQFNPEKPPKLVARVTFFEPSGNRILDAEEHGAIIIRISNEGKGPAFNLSTKLVKIKVDAHISFPSEKTIPSIYPGKSVEIKFPIFADYLVKSVKNSIRVQFKDQFGFQPDPIVLEFFTHKEEPPKLFVKNISIDDDSYGKSFGDNDKQIELGETIEVTVSIGNKGTGPAQNVSAEIFKGKTNYLFLGDKTKFNLGYIVPGKEKIFSFIFSTNKLYTGQDVLPLKINIFEKRKRFSRLNQSLNLRLNKFMNSEQYVAVSPLISSAGKEINIEDVPVNPKKNRNGIAVIIGNMHYQKSGVPEVKYAARDAALMREYVMKLFGYSAENIIYLQDATKADFDRIFGTENNFKGKLYNYVTSRESEVFIYYTGHGAPDVENRQGYFVPVDCDPTYVRLTGYPLNRFYENLTKLTTKKITVVIDACFSGQSDAGFILNNISPIFIKIKEPLFQINNLLLFTSSRADQVSHWYPQKEHSLFTYCFLKGIKEKYEKTKQSVSAGDLFNILSKEVNQLSRRLYGREQQPMFWGDKHNAIF